MKKILLILGAIGALAVLVVLLLFKIDDPPRKGELLESWESSNTPIKIRIEKHAETGGFGPIKGAFYVFSSAEQGSEDWQEIMTFRHDDPVEIPRDQIGVVNKRFAFVFMGWKYAVTKDGGKSWKAWDIRDALEDKRGNYGLIKNIEFNEGGFGIAQLSVIKSSNYEIKLMKTDDFGKSWKMARNSTIFGEIDANNLKDFYSGRLSVDGRMVEIDLNFESRTTEKPTLAGVDEFLAMAKNFLGKAFEGISEDYDSSETSEGRLYLQHHLDEFSQEEITKLFGQKIVNKKNFMGALRLVRIGLYPESEDEYAVFDIQLPPDVTNYLLSVRMDRKGKITSISMES